MAASSAEGVKWLKVAQVAGADAGAAAAADAGTVGADPNPGEDLPPNFGTMIGILAIINWNRTDATRRATSYGLNPAQLKTASDNVANTVGANHGLTASPQFQAIVKGLPGGAEGVTANSAADITKIFTTLADTHNSAQIEDPQSGQPAGEQAIALQFAPAPTGTGGSANAPATWTTISNEFKGQLKTQVETMRAAPLNVPTASLWTKRDVTAQMAPSDPQTLGAPVPPAAPAAPAAPAQPAQQGPLGAGRYESMDQLKQELIQKGASPETYDWFMTLVGEDREDDAKEALSSFFQGLAAALCALYDMLVDAGMASPIDAEIVENLMNQHPEASPGNGQKPDPKTAGLFLPPPDSGIYTKIEKTASGSVGGAGAGYGAYVMDGPSDNRMCPKIKKPVSTFICRYHCLDGLAVDDHQVLCGQAIWLDSMMDKFSREYRDKDGKWVGGYLRKRYEIQEDDGGHPYLLPPGERSAPLHEDAWSYEKRLQEMRRSEGSKRGYSETPGDPKDLYNFDSYDLQKGPKNPQLFEKKKDPIAKIADSMFDGVTKTAEPKKEKGKGGDPFENVPWAKPEPQEQNEGDFGGPAVPGKEKKEPAKPWNKSKKKKADAESPLWKKAHGYDLREDGGGTHDDAMMMGPGNDMGTVMKRCSQCGSNISANLQVCDRCGSNQVQNISPGQAQSETGGVTRPEFTPKAWSKMEVRFANGVYRATQGDVSAFGDSENQAIEKLAQGLANSTPAPLGQQNEQLLGLRHNDEQEQMGNAANQVLPPPQPPVAEQGIAPSERVVPEGQGVPAQAVSPIPEEVQGGQSEFALPGAEQPVAPAPAAPAAAPAGPGHDIFLNGEELDREAEGHVGADALDKELEMAASSHSPDEHAEIENQAVAMGAHPA